MSNFTCCFMVTKVMVFGSFDVLHDGHRSLFKQAKRFGDYLIVIIARDETYKEIRGYAPMHNEYERLASVADEALVDEAFLGDVKDKYRAIRTYRPNVICLGYDQEHFIAGLSEKLAAFGLKNTKVVRLESFKPDRLKSSILKKL